MLLAGVCSCEHNSEQESMELCNSSIIAMRYGGFYTYSEADLVHSKRWRNIFHL